PLLSLLPERRHRVPVVPPPCVCVKTDRPSWLLRSHPHGLTPITLPAASCLPLVPIGAPWADSMSARIKENPPSMLDIRLYALSNSQTYRSVSLLSGGVHIWRARFGQPGGYIGCRRIGTLSTVTIQNADLYSNRHTLTAPEQLVPHPGQRRIAGLDGLGKGRSLRQE